AYWPREDRDAGAVLDGSRLFADDVAWFQWREVYRTRKLRGFKSVLRLVDDTWKKHPREVSRQADALARATARELEGATRLLPLFDLERGLVTEAVEHLVAQFDRAHGGLGSPARDFRGTKFPTTPRLLLLEEEAERTGSKQAARVLDVTLDHMARGGIYDQLGGGFHRYSTERTWTVPHFEKMLYDSAQLAEVYALA